MTILNLSIWMDSKSIVCISFYENVHTKTMKCPSFVLFGVVRFCFGLVIVLMKAWHEI